MSCVPQKNQTCCKKFFLVNCCSLNKCTVFTRIIAAALKFFAPRVQCLIEGSVYLKIGSYKEILSFNLTVYLLSVQKVIIIEASFHYHHSAHLSYAEFLE